MNNEMENKWELSKVKRDLEKAVVRVNEENVARLVTNFVINGKNYHVTIEEKKSKKVI